MNQALQQIQEEANPNAAAAPEVDTRPRVMMGKCAKCGRGNRKVYRGGNVYWCRPCILHEARRRERNQKQEGK